MIQLIAIDLDGTLLRNDKTLSEASKQAVQWASDQGVEVVICSGRPLSGVRPIIEALGLDQPNHHSIIFNGGAVIDNATQEIMSQTTLAPEAVEEIAQILLAHELPADAVSLTQGFQFDALAEWPSTYPERTPYLTFSQWTLPPAAPIYKVVATTTAAHLDAVIAQLPQRLFEQYAVVRSQTYQLEIMPRTVSKGKALKTLAKQLGIPLRQVMTIGDEENDLSMLTMGSWAVVMANGNPAVKAVADYITDTNEKDGVSLAIRQFVTPKERR